MPITPPEVRTPPRAQPAYKISSMPQIRSAKNTYRLRNQKPLSLGLQLQQEVEMSGDENRVIEMTADIVSAYVGNNTVSTDDLPLLIKNIHDALKGVSTGAPAEPIAPQTPAVSVRRSITPDALICLEDGRKFKSLKRHLQTKYGMSPDDYRAKWGLPKDYPMVAPNYAASRSALAKQMGLGQGGRQAAKPVAAAKAASARKPRAK